MSARLRPRRARCRLTGWSPTTINQAAHPRPDIVGLWYTAMASRSVLVFAAPAAGAYPPADEMAGAQIDDSRAVQSRADAPSPLSPGDEDTYDRATTGDRHALREASTSLACRSRTSSAELERRLRTLTPPALSSGSTAVVIMAALPPQRHDLQDLLPTAQPPRLCP